MCDITNGYLQAEGIKCFGINSNRINRNKEATITEFDSLKQKDAQSILDSI